MSDHDDLTPLTPEEARAAFAAEAALGLLSGAEAAEARRLQAEDAGFAAEVRGWHERLAALAHELPEETPSPAVRERLNDRLASAAAAGKRREAPQRRRAPWAWLGGLAAAGVAALALLLLPPMLRGPVPIAGADLVASAPVPLRLETQLLEDGRSLIVRVAEGAMPEGRDAELWWIADAQAVPVSLGVVPRAGEAVLTLPADLAYAAGVQLAISDEPLGGSPSGQPTGAVLAAAPLTTL